MSTESEVWAPIAGYGNKYEVSSLGRVRIARSGFMKAVRINTRGYAQTNLLRRSVRVHRLVASAFCEKKPGCDVVNHKNFIQTDNRPENLEWTTHKLNVAHAVAGGHCAKPHKVTLPVAEAIKALRALPEEIRPSARLIAQFLGISRKSVVRCHKLSDWRKYQQKRSVGQEGAAA